MSHKHTISVLVENEFGVLTRIAGLFSGRGYNIDSLSVAPTLDERYSRMTIVTIATDRVIEQIIKQLNKLINVIKVHDVTSEDPINCILAMIKVNLSKRNEDKLKKHLRGIDAKIVFQDDKCSILRVVADEAVLAKLVDALNPYGIMEFISTGNIAMQRGKKVIKA